MPAYSFSDSFFSLLLRVPGKSLAQTAPPTRRCCPLQRTPHPQGNRKSSITPPSAFMRWHLGSLGTRRPPAPSTLRSKRANEDASRPRSQLGEPQPPWGRGEVRDWLVQPWWQYLTTVWVSPGRAERRQVTGLETLRLTGRLQHFLRHRHQATRSTSLYRVFCSVSQRSCVLPPSWWTLKKDHIKRIKEKNLKGKKGRTY